MLCGEYISIFEPLSLIYQAPFETTMRWTKIDDSYLVIHSSQGKYTYRLPITDIDSYDDYKGILELFKMYHISSEMGCHIDILSCVPQKSGLGSSASLLVACAKGIEAFYGLSSPFLLDHCKNAEYWYHGISSGIDVLSCFYGGALCIQGQGEQRKIEHLPLLPLKGVIVHTGLSDSYTSDCVSHVLKMHPSTSSLWSMGRLYALSMIESYKKKAIAEFYHSVNQYDDFLRQLGVVPMKVQMFLNEWKSFGGVGKICGSGSVEGEGAGIVMLLHDDDHQSDAITSLCRAFGYSILFQI